MESLVLEKNVFFLAIIGMLGLIIGSFLNVVALRLLAEKDFIKGRSECPNCNNLIAWYDNIPVISYIWLLGKCRKCKAKISIQYPIVELVTAGLFIAVVYKFGVTLNSLFLLILTCNLVVLTITDWKEKYIFDINSVPMIPLGLVYNFFDIGHNSVETVKILGLNVNDVLVSAVIGAVIGAAFFEILSRVGLLLAGEYAFGAGDSILAAALGAWFGWKFIIIILILSFVFQMFIGVPVLFYNTIKEKDYKTLAALVTMFVSIVIAYSARFFVESGNALAAISMIVLAFILVGISVFVVLKQTRERQNHTFLPFGPAIVLAGLYVMFFGELCLQSFPILQ